MLLGRSEEQAAISRLLDGARNGKSGTLIIRGEPGIGKSALLRHAAAAASSMQLLTTTGIEAESELPFAGLSELLHPLLGHIEQLAAPQAAALMGALALGPPAGDRFTVAAATLALIAAGAEARPLLITVDDAQWLDSASLEAILFTARRLQADAVAILLTVRTNEPVAVEAPGLPEIVLSGLDLEASRQLLESSAPTHVKAPVAELVHTATRGNPLAIIEVSRVLPAAQLSGAEPLTDPLPAGPLILRSFERRIGTLPAATQTALLVCAATQSGSSAEVRQACGLLRVDFSALELAEEAGLISNDGDRIRFAHPLIRAAAYHRTAPPARRAVHRALADCLSEAATVRAWHLAAAASGEDEHTASALESAALEARRRSAHAVASVAFERAARLSPSAESRARRLLEAASDAHMAGSSAHGLQLLDKALEHSNDLRMRVEILHTKGRIQMWSDSPAAARKLLLLAAETIEPFDRDKAALILVDAATTCHQEGDPVEGVLAPSLRTSQRAFELARGRGGVAEAAARGLLGKTLILCGRPDEGYPLLLQCQEFIDQTDSIWVAVQLAHCSVVFLWLEAFERARLSLERLISWARASSAPGALPYPMAHLSEVDLRMGRWQAAYAGAGEAMELARELGQTNALIYALICMAWVEAGQGREAECRAHLAEAITRYGPLGVTMAAYSAAISSLLELGLRRSDAAIAVLEPFENIMAQEGMGEPGLFQSLPNLIEAYVHVGDRARANAALERLQYQAASTKRSWPQAVVARCRGLLAESDFAEAFEEASSWHAQTPMPFERARTQLCYGERLRRARRRGEAREQLHAALDVFQQLGAAAWAVRAEDELRAAGEALSRVKGATAEDLTLQELQIAVKVARGATNREVAAALFLSPKTVEAHLSHVYSKLGIRSRTELAHRFAGATVREPVGSAERRPV